MTTVINTPPTNNGESTGFGLIIGIILTVLVIGLFFIYGLPALRNSGENRPQTENSNTEIRVTLPGNDDAGGDNNGANSGSGNTGVEDSGN